MSKDEDIDVIFTEEEPTTQRRELLTSVLNLLSELEAEADGILRVMQADGLTPETKGKASQALMKINGIIRSIEASFGLYRNIRQ